VSSLFGQAGAELWRAPGRLKSLQRLLTENRGTLVAAINADCGNRAEFETLFAEFFTVLETISDTGRDL
jgi:coniferyl-aldehyde dehydrogenase